MHEPPAGRFALLVGVQTHLDPAFPNRPGTVVALRQIEARLLADGWRVRALLDDAPSEAGRPLAANLLDALSALEGEEDPLIVLSAHADDAVVVTRDARAQHLAHTGLPAAVFFGAMPPDACLILDCGLGQGGAWALSAHADDKAGEKGPSRFLIQLGRALSGAVDAAQLAQLLIERTDAHLTGRPNGGLVGPPKTSGRRCERCQSAIDDATATFCPACGGPLGIHETIDSGRYRIVRQLGEGGMGAVYLAEDTRLGTQRALKMLALPAGLAPAEVEHLRERLLQEARAAQVLAQKCHHVTRVFDVGYSPERAEPFLVMELLDGQTLASDLEGGPLSVEEASRIAHDIAVPLAVAHAEGMVHRDLKPDNIMLVQRGDEPRYVKLLDFGLVKMAGPIKTRTGQMMGTLQYMAPEQLRGQPVDASADVFALGAVFYECLSGVRAIPGVSQQAIFATLLDTGVAPLASVVPDLPGGLIDLVDRCLSLDRSARPKDAQAFLDQLSAVSELTKVSDTARAKTPVTTPFDGSEDVDGADTPTPLPSRPSVAPDEPPAEVRGGESRRLPVLAVVGVISAIALFFVFRATTGSAPPGVLVGAADARIASADTADSATRLEPPADASPVGDSPVDAAAPRPLDLSALPDETAVIGQLTPTGVRYGGGGPLDRVAALVLDVAVGERPFELTRAEREAWADAPGPVRRALTEPLSGVPLAHDDVLQVSKAAFEAARTKRPRRVTVRGIGALWAWPDGVIVGKPRCHSLAPGDRVVTLRWSIRGYTRRQCAPGAACLRRLARDLKTAQSVGERLDARLTVERETDGSEAVEQSVRCAVGP